jgi:hypothetical protein
MVQDVRLKPVHVLTGGVWFGVGSNGTPSQSYASGLQRGHHTVCHRLHIRGVGNHERSLSITGGYLSNLFQHVKAEHIRSAFPFP